MCGQSSNLKVRFGVPLLVISIVLLVSQYLSLAFFWWNLYLPEMRQHAHYVAVNLTLLRDAEKAVYKTLKP
jgi:two-component system osmolarity sensor histidine kinase EnvZ